MCSDEPSSSDKKPIFNKDHFTRLLKYSSSHKYQEWNAWRRANPEERVLLEGAEFVDTNLQRFDLSNALLRNAKFIRVNLDHAHLYRSDLEKTEFLSTSLKSAVLKAVNLRRARFDDANLEGAKFLHCDLSSSALSGAVLCNAELLSSDLRHSLLAHANFNGACLKHSILSKIEARDASFMGADLGWTNLEYAEMTRARLKSANLKRASLIKAHLRETDLRGANVENTDLRSTLLDDARVNEVTSFRGCLVDRKTSFHRIPLGSLKIDTGTRQLLEYNLRRRAWEAWCKKCGVLGRLSRIFWIISDYGLSTTRILQCFLITALVFALIYWGLAYLLPPGVISNLTIDPTGQPIPPEVVPLRSMYFSIVTMTTLGFGDMYAEPASAIGYALLIFQVVLGYVMLGAIVTRFSILFTQGGPSARHMNNFEEGKCKSAFWPEEELAEFARKMENHMGLRNEEGN